METYFINYYLRAQNWIFFSTVFLEPVIKDMTSVKLRQLASDFFFFLWDVED